MVGSGPAKHQAVGDQHAHALGAAVPFERTGGHVAHRIADCQHFGGIGGRNEVALRPAGWARKPPCEHSGGPRHHFVRFDLRPQQALRLRFPPRSLPDRNAHPRVASILNRIWSLQIHTVIGHCLGPDPGRSRTQERPRQRVSLRRTFSFVAHWIAGSMTPDLQDHPSARRHAQ